MPRLTRLQGQYIAFIYNYTRMNGRPPAESDLQAYFRTTAPTIHDMILRLELHGAIAREPWTARSIRVLLPPEEIPRLE